MMPLSSKKGSMMHVNTCFINSRAFVQHAWKGLIKGSLTSLLGHWVNILIKH